MQEIRLLRMSIRNFKGIRELDISFGGKDMNILGDNGTGKTTIIDSFTWLLFGKDSLGRADFGIKPTDKAGNIIHQQETSVEAVFDISGISKVFKKTLEEVWTRKRGAAEAEFTRNENNFYIDGVPKKKMEYTAAIKELIDEEVFKIITNPLYFNESVKWQDRRSVLLTICGEVSDGDVIAANEELSPLLPLLQGKAVSDFKDITAATMKRINRELDMIPVKISEAELAKPSSVLDVDHARKEQLTKDIEALRVQKSNIQNGTEVAMERQAIKMLEEELKAVGRGFNPDLTPEAAQIAKLKTNRTELTTKLYGIEVNCRRFQSGIEAMNADRENLSKEWDKVFGEQFTDSICPTCHRELPEEEVEARRKEFNGKKAQRLDAIEQKNASIAKNVSETEEALKNSMLEAAELKIAITENEEAAIKAQNAFDEMCARNNAEIQQRKMEICKSIKEKNDIIKSYEERTGEAVAEIESKIGVLSGELQNINAAESSNALLQRQDNRIAALQNQQRRLAAEYTRMERSLYLAEQFIVAKVNMLNERINQKFRYAKFKLFDKQINGGINEVCEVTYGGIPYKDLNNAMRINIGLDVINAISAHYGVTCPIMIDNAESVNELFHTAAQQVRFYVSMDKKLVFENKED